MDDGELDARNSRLLRDVSEASLALTHTERRCLEYLSRGMTPHMVAHAIHCSHSTVYRYLDHAQIKLSAKSPLQACCEALRQGLID